MGVTRQETLQQRVNSDRMFERARRTIPGGVNSPVRAFGGVGGNPVFVTRADGATIWDLDDNAYLDYVGSWGPMILGHNHPVVRAAVERALASGTSFGAPTEAEVELAELVVDIVPSVEVVRLVNSGTEATMSAARLARAATDRSKVIKFRGGYHGHADIFLVEAGSGAATIGVPSSPGVPNSTAGDTLVAEYNDLPSVELLFDANRDAIACVIVEPVAGNMGCVPPAEGFLEGLRELCTRTGALLIFDEVMTGFRVALGGAQQLFGVTPDLTTLGKVLGGGLPVGAYGGSKYLMRHIAPDGPAMQQFTNDRSVTSADEIWFCEHRPVFTLGLNAAREHLLAPGDIPVIQIDRGGQVTYHGPGQLMIYPLVDIRRAGLNVRKLVSGLEQSVVDLAAEFGIAAAGRRDAPGVYVNGVKLASIGLRIRRGASFHGMALNVNVDLEPFSRINTCGFENLDVTDLARLGGEQDPDLVIDRLTPHLLKNLRLDDAILTDAVPPMAIC